MTTPEPSPDGINWRLVVLLPACALLALVLVALDVPPLLVLGIALGCLAGVAFGLHQREQRDR